MNEVVSKHHRYYTRLAAKRIKVEIVERPTGLLDEWCAFFQYTVSNHSLSGIRAFSRRTFDIHLSLPGSFMFSARVGDEIVGMLLCFQHQEYAYLHLVGVSPLGYEKGASYALYSSAMEFFRHRVPVG